MEIPTNKSEIINVRGKSLKDMNSHGKTMRRHFVSNINDENFYLKENRKREFNKGDTKFTEKNEKTKKCYLPRSGCLESCIYFSKQPKSKTNKQIIKCDSSELYEYEKDKEQSRLEKIEIEKGDKYLSKLSLVQEDFEEYDLFLEKEMIENNYYFERELKNQLEREELKMESFDSDIIII
jgi:hypothetical protein